jgi:hypothetical protein
MKELECAIDGPSTAEDFYELTVSAGMARGKPQVELESIMEFARYKQEPIARFKCSFGGIMK